MSEDLVTGREEANSKWKDLVQKENPWIKVSDRLPEGRGYYYTKSKYPDFYINEPRNQGVEFYEGHIDDDYWQKHYSHWQPVTLPEPPKE